MSDLFEQIKAVPIESAMREYFPSVELKHSGREVAARCPFHAEKTASFKIYTKKKPLAVLRRMRQGRHGYRLTTHGRNCCNAARCR